MVAAQAGQVGRRGGSSWPRSRVIDVDTASRRGCRATAAGEPAGQIASPDGTVEPGGRPVPRFGQVSEDAGGRIGEQTAPCLLTAVLRRGQGSDSLGGDRAVAGELTRCF